MKRPNILLITSDQHRPDCFGFAGRNIKTPHLDQLATQGTRFDCAITPNVVCQPARASILTGMLPLTHGVYDNQISLDPAVAQRGWAGNLSKAGYVSKFIGKAHFGNDARSTPWGAPEMRSESENIPDDWNGPYMGFNDIEMMILGHWHPLLPCEKPPRGLHFERWFWSHKDAWELWQQDSRTDRSSSYGVDAAQTWNSALPAEWHSTTWVTDRTINFLEEQKNADQPFCLWTSYPDPHHPFDCPEPWASLHKSDEVDISRTHQRDLDKRPWWHRASLEQQPTGTQINRTLRTEYSRIEPQTDQQLAAMTANYYNMIAFVDDGVGKIMQSLNDCGLAEDTIVIFTADHGEFLGDHGLYLKGPMHYDSLLRVGMIMRGPGIKENQIVSSPVSTMDLSATFHDWADVKQDDEAQAVSLDPVLQNDEAVRHHVYNEWNVSPKRIGVELKLRTIRTENARLTVELNSEEGELYNLSDDPDEMFNLWNDNSARGLKQELMDCVHFRPGSVALEVVVHSDEREN
ncbi:MAG: arylsulfatase A-like enzyme [Parasphingorhabdus sp.]|jgi:arylsulfatase A-like enzyme